MAISSVRLLAIFFFFLVIFVSLSTSEIRYTKIRSNDHLIIPLDDFGFGLTGNIDLNVSDISFPNYETSDVSLLGFFLIPKDSLIHLADDIQQNKICPLRSKLVELISDFRNIPHGSHSLSISHRTQHPNKYTLIFANCIPSQPISMDVSSAMYNFDLRTANRNYLSAGESTLPWFFFFFSLVYAGLTVLWIQTLRKNRSTVFKIHFFMLFVVVLKALNLLCEAEEKSFISRTGTAHGWDILFYIFSFLKGISLFSLIVLIGTGWSFLKIYLQDREKKVLMIVIPLQVIANIAQIVIDESGPYEVDWITWKQVFMLVDVVCCCAVLFPIVWSIKNLREAAKTDGKAAVNLMKLTIFRHYYIIVICYIYFTRVVVYALVTITSYKYAWTSVVAGELATLAFYVFTGYKFKPEPRNPYFAIDDEEEEAAAEALKLEDEFEL